MCVTNLWQNAVTSGWQLGDNYSWKEQSREREGEKFGVINVKYKEISQGQNKKKKKKEKKSNFQKHRVKLVIKNL